MTDVPAEVVARGRAIFDRLRGTAAPGATDTGHGDSADERVEAPAEDSPDPTQMPPADDAVTVTVLDVDHLDDPAPTPDPPEPVTAADSGGAAPSDATAEEALGATAPTEPSAGPEPTATEPSAAAPTPAAPQPVTDHSVGDEIGLGSEVPAVEALVTVPEVADPTVDAEPSVAAAPPPPDLPTPDARRSPADPTGEAGSEGSRFARPLPRVIAVANQKGGVGKTTTTVNLAACLADLGYRVLIVDLDPQGNASTGVGINIRDLANSMYDVLLRDAPMEDCIEATSVRNLYVAPANLELAGAEIELVPAFSRELKLRAAIDSIRDDYDFVFVDCPPSLGLLTVNSLAAASEVLVPIQCEYYALEGLGQLLRNVGLVQKNLNPTLEVSVIVCVMYDARTKLADQVVAEVRAHFGEKVCRTVVPRTVRLSEAPSYGQPISAFDPSSRGAIAYKELAKEVGGGTPQRVG